MVSQWPMPTDADVLFTEATSSWWENGCLSKGGGTGFRLAMIATGYKHAADLCVQRALENRSHSDSLVYPIVFCYRHYIEISLKDVIATYGWRVGVKPNWNGHRLKELWREFCAVLNGFNVEHETDGIVERLLADFAKFDPGSDSFRYPTDKKGVPIAFDLERLDLRNLRDVMDRIETYFVGVGGHLDSLAKA